MFKIDMLTYTEKSSQNHPNSFPKASKILSKSSQARPKRHLRASQNDAKIGFDKICFQDNPKCPQEASKRPPRNLQETSKRPPRGLQEASKKLPGTKFGAFSMDFVRILEGFYKVWKDLEPKKSQVSPSMMQDRPKMVPKRIIFRSFSRRVSRRVMN